MILTDATVLPRRGAAGPGRAWPWENHFVILNPFAGACPERFTSPSLPPARLPPVASGLQDDA